MKLLNNFLSGGTPDRTKKYSDKKRTQQIFLFFLFFSFNIQAQTYTIKGKVTTSISPVEFAKVTFIDQRDFSKQFTTFTDTAGNFRFDLITSIKTKEHLPQKFNLFQNYPNPFNSSTSISYNLNEENKVTIKIYDILGREVRILTEQQQTIGYNKVLWDGRNNLGDKVASGIYFYKMQIDQEMMIKKMIFTESNVPVINIPAAILSANTQEIQKEVLSQSSSATYLVQITNTENTFPKIQFTEFSDITIQRDTTINILVQLDAQWHFLGLENETITAIAVDPINTNIIYAGSLSDFSAGINGKLFKSINDGKTWDTLLIGGSYSEILIDPINTDIIYALPRNIIKSENGGKTWQPIREGIYIDAETRLLSLVMNPKNSNILYAGTVGFFGGNLYKSLDGGLHWNEIGNDSLRDGVICIAIDPVDTNNVYAGTADRGILWKSTDAGATWFNTNLGKVGTYDILIDPQKHTRLYAGIPQSGIYKSEDGGVTWENFSAGLSENFSAMKIQQSYKSRLFLIGGSRSGSGIFEFSNIKTQWVKISNNEVPMVFYDSALKVISNPQRLYFGGKGIYFMDLKY